MGGVPDCASRRERMRGGVPMYAGESLQARRFAPLDLTQAGLALRMISALGARILGDVAFDLSVLDRPAVRIGEGAPRFSLRLRTPRAVRAALLLRERAIGEAY